MPADRHSSDREEARVHATPRLGPAPSDRSRPAKPSSRGAPERLPAGMFFLVGDGAFFLVGDGAFVLVGDGAFFLVGDGAA
ncbi:hypothetical protein FRX94_13015 [Corynebacterium canis]|uniref:Uncharacterized protein n=1 Tax=Corynebacterium canis TaxID=679663 RepID=A0A5C5TT83_9CORY|nr:hypothetical protein [Corynebacterium canis]TWT16887.1 hypothetical protein FRX94_13015 [Corynebacterium canis]WJY76128.1 hypothetical protein CCANI_11575 [Corynebacterium canis]